MTKPRVFVSRKIPPNGIEVVARHCDVEVWPGDGPPSRPELLRKIAGCDGVLSLLSDRMDAEAMDAAGANLKVISNFAVGFNNVDVDEANRRGIHVGNTPDVLTDATADVAVALLLAATRRLKEGIDQVRTGQWQTWDPNGFLGGDLKGKTLGIVGMGRIGLETARRLAAGWQMDVVYTSRTNKPDADGQLGARRVTIDELLAQSDFISIHADLNPTTENLFAADAFEKMKSSAVLINTARGGLIDQDALVGALRDGQIRAAGLDVTSPEPLSMDHPLVGLPNCTIVPHIGSATHQARHDMAEIAAANLVAGVHGDPLRCEVGSVA